MSKDYYKTLGIDKNASHEDVQKAFKKLARQYHPDNRATGDEAKFKEINEAYQVLGNAEKRKQYDQFGADFDEQGGFGQGMNWEDFMRAARGQGGFGNAGGFDFGGVDLGEIFGDLFGFGGSASARRGRATARRGRDIQVDAEIDFKEAAFGVEREISLRKSTTCDVCGGSGAEPGAKMETCSTCGGRGQVIQHQRTFLGTVQTVTTCTVCGGRGQKPEKRCKHCGGDGAINKTVSFKMKIPAGIDDGEMIRLSGRGEAAPHGGQSGDLYVRVHVRPHKSFERDGFDVYADTEVSYPQAVLGDTIQVETLDGLLKIAVPEGTEHGQLIRLKGRGIARLHGSGRGDHYVRIKIKVPKKISRQARNILEELMGEL